MEKVGNLVLEDTVLHVFRGYFRSDIEDNDFSRLAVFLRDELKVHLLEKLPELCPIWPPLVKQEEGYIYHSGVKKIYSRVISGNDIPKTYLYRGINPVPEMLTNKEGCVEIYTRKNDITINIDRKYTSNGSSFICKNYKFDSVGNECEYYQEKNRLIISGLDSKIIYYVKADGTIEKIKGVSDYEIINFGKKDIVIITSHRFVIEKILYDLSEYDESSDFNEKKLLMMLRKYKTQKMVTLPYMLRKKIEKLKCEDDELLREIFLIIKTNKITVSAAKILEEAINDRY